MSAVSSARPGAAIGGMAAGAPWHGVCAPSRGTSQLFQLPVAGTPDGSMVAIPINVARGAGHGPPVLVVAGQQGGAHRSAREMRAGRGTPPTTLAGGTSGGER